MYSIIKCYLRHILAVCVVSLCVMTGTAASSVKLDVACFHAKTRFDLGNTARILV